MFIDCKITSEENAGNENVYQTKSFGDIKLREECCHVTGENLMSPR